MTKGKYAPSVIEGESRLDGRRGLGEYVKDYVARARHEQNVQSDWYERKRMYYERRYGRTDERVMFPWPDASNIRLPMFDIHIEEIKAPILNMMIGQNRIFNMVPRNAQAVLNAQRAARAMDDLLKFRMPDYLHQRVLAIDSWAQNGVAIDKIYYSYVTRQQPETIRWRDLPVPLSQLAVSEKNTPEQVQLAANMGITLMNKAQFDKAAKQIRSVVDRLYDLDSDDKMDQAAGNEIMSFLRNSGRDSKIIIKRRAVIENTPRIINVPLEDIIVPIGTNRIEEAEFLAHRMFFSESDLRQRARDNVWDSTAVDAALNVTSDRGSYTRTGDEQDILWQAKRDRIGGQTGYETSPTEQYEVWECYGWWDIDGDGLDEKVVITIEPETETVLKAIELPFDHGEWPFVSSVFEACDHGIHSSRGIPEKTDNLSRHADALARAEQNNLLIQTSQSFTYREDSGINPLAMPWMPGLMIPVRQHDDLREIAMSPRALALEQPMRNALSLMERVVTGGTRQVLDQPPPDRRTATEVQAYENATRRLLGVRGLLWNDGQSRSGKQCWALWRQYGPDEWYAVVSGDKMEKMTQVQIAGDFDIRPVGAVSDMDPQYREQLAMQTLDITMKLAPALGDDPTVEINILPVFEEWLYQKNPLLAPAVLQKLTPEQSQAKLQALQQKAAQSQQIEQMGQAALANVPMTPEDMKRLLYAMTRSMPHRELQNLIVQGEQDGRAEMRAGLLASANGRAQ